MPAKGIRFVRESKTEDYGTVAVFEDLYGIFWTCFNRLESDCVQRAAYGTAATF